MTDDFFEEMNSDRDAERRQNETEKVWIKRQINRSREMANSVVIPFLQDLRNHFVSQRWLPESKFGPVVPIHGDVSTAYFEVAVTETANIRLEVSIGPSENDFIDVEISMPGVSLRESFDHLEDGPLKHDVKQFLEKQIKKHRGKLDNAIQGKPSAGDWSPTP